MAQFDKMVADIICDTFRKEVGKWGGYLPGKSHGLPQKALKITFSARLNYEKEDGYRYFELILYGPANYIGVYSRRRWNVRPVDSDGGYGEYKKGASNWGCHAYHDSCWPDGVERFLRGDDRNIIGLHSLDRWYKVVTLDEETVAALRKQSS